MSEAPTGLSSERGVRLALDWGRARVGVAACDPDGTLAYPVETIPSGPRPTQRAEVLRRVRQLVTEYEPVELVLGWPTNLRGDEGPAVVAMRAVEAELVAAFPSLPVVRVDERMSTAEAARKLAGAGRDSRQRRGIIDQAAAVGILDSALDNRRAKLAQQAEEGTQ